MYIKARGLPDGLFKGFLNANGGQPRNVKIDDLLDRMNVPIVQSDSLHVEFILKMEGKAVLSYYLNEKAYQKLTYRHSEYIYIHLFPPTTLLHTPIYPLKDSSHIINGILLCVCVYVLSSYRSNHLSDKGR